jgi:hypothetical protein
VQSEPVFGSQKSVSKEFGSQREGACAAGAAPQLSARGASGGGGDGGLDAVCAVHLLRRGGWIDCQDSAVLFQRGRGGADSVEFVARRHASDGAGDRIAVPCAHGRCVSAAEDAAAGGDHRCGRFVGTYAMGAANPGMVARSLKGIWRGFGPQTANRWMGFAGFWVVWEAFVRISAESSGLMPPE